MTFLRRGPWKARSPWKGRGPWCAKSPWGVADIPWTLDATAAAIREAISNADAWGTTGAVTGWRLPGHGGVRLSADAMTGPRLEQQQDGGFRWAAHNLHTSSEPSSAFTAGGTTPPTVGTGTLNGKTAPTITFDQTMGTGFGGSRALQTGSVGFTFAAGASYSQQQRVKLSRLLTGGEAVTIYSTGDQGFSQSTINASNSDQYVGINGGLLVNSLTAASGGGVSKPYIYLAGAMQSSLTVTMTEFQANVGALTAYVPTAGAARYAPAVTWDAALGVWGLRSEPAATNRVLWSRDLSNAAWTKSNATATLTATGTDGAANSASVLTATGANATATQAITSTSRARVLSIFLRRRTGTGTVETTIDGGTTWVARTLTSAWQRFQTTVTSTNPTIGVRIVTSGDAVDVDYVQEEDGAVATSPIPTFAATVTRTVDAPSNSLATATEGTVVVDYIPAAAGSQNVLSLDDGTANERHLITNDGVYAVTDGGAAQASIDGGTPNVGALNRVAITWAANRFVASLNGGAVVEDTSGTVPTTTRAVMADGANVLTTRIRAGARAVPSDRARSLAV
jgi:hypothetical protein